MSTQTWAAPTAFAPLAGRVEVPGSKSMANRALVLAGLANGPSQISGLPTSRDTSLMIDALTGLGVAIESRPEPGRASITVDVYPPNMWRGGGDIDAGLAGTVMRFVPPLALLANQPTHFHGDARASWRPMGPLLDALGQLGANVENDNGKPARALPFKLTPPPGWATLPDSSKTPAQMGPITIDASASSQFVSGLLLAATHYPGGLDLRHIGDAVPSRPHIDMTIAMLADRGVHVAEPEPNHWLVPAQMPRAKATAIEPDLTNAAVFLAGAAVAEGWAEVANWPTNSTQPGAMVADIIVAFGGWAKRGNGVLRVGADRPLRAVDIDLSACGELTPVVAGLAAVANGVSRLSGIGHIRGHETDRLAAIADALGAVGVTVEIDSDDLVIFGGQPRHPGLVEARGDHRLVHLGALLGLVTPGVIIDDVAAVAKTMPDFTSRWAGFLQSEPASQ